MRHLKSRSLLISFALLTLLVLAACAPITPTPQSDTPQSPPTNNDMMGDESDDMMSEDEAGDMMDNESGEWMIMMTMAA